MNALDNKILELKNKAQMKSAEIEGQVKEQMTRPMSGATAMEYVLIVSIMAGVIIIAWRNFLGPAITGRMQGVSDEITHGF